MSKRIRQLPIDIANQIAAGEVVERPASVVKELLENAADAEATQIGVTIGYGGLNWIQVADDGQGIPADDLPLAVMAHATSKISCLNDLFQISSMGFRGEALASIASVSRLSIASRTASQDQAIQLQPKEKQWQAMPCARSQGTTVEVADLFYNAPVRKRFLKSERSEFLRIEQVVKCFALARPDIGLQLHHNGRQLLDLPPATEAFTQAKRVQKILGKAFFDNALPVDVHRANMHLSGWISAPPYQRSQQDKQWIYVNQRMVRDKLLNHALKQAYEGQLHPGRHPSCVLYLCINAQEVDVNVHPTKHELRFQEPRLVHDFLVSSLHESLSQYAVHANETPPNASPEAHAVAMPPAGIAPPHLTKTSNITEKFQDVSTDSKRSAAGLRDPEVLDRSPECNEAAAGRWEWAAQLLQDNSNTPSHGSRRYPYNDSRAKIACLGELSPHTGRGTKDFWQPIDAEFSVFFHQHAFWIARTNALRAAMLAWELKDEPLPWQSRPLLLPIPLPELPARLQTNHWQAVLGKLGINLGKNAEGGWILKTIPRALPQLDIKAFIQALQAETVLDETRAREICSQCGKPSAGEEITESARVRLAQFLSDCSPLTAEALPYLRRLDTSLCQSLFAMSETSHDFPLEAGMQKNAPDADKGIKEGQV